MNTTVSAAARRTIESAVLERAQHTSKSKAQDTWSFARAERLLGKEYHGRFLIELLQNAADAWREAHAHDDSTCDLVVIIDESLSLSVANRGVPFPAEIVLESLGQIGLSSKEVGEAIGHKGIGFKSTLEVSTTPEIYSFTDGFPSLAVRFDAARARERILDQSPEWDSWVADQDEFQQDPLRAVPILRYPTWVDSLPGAVAQLGSQGYDTVVRLPHAAGDDRGRWLSKVRDALADVSDQILVLLGIFDRVRIEDRVAGTSEDIVVTTVPGDGSQGTTADTRRLLVKAAWHHRRSYHVGVTLQRPWDLAPAAAHARGDAGNRRLHARQALHHRQRRHRPRAGRLVLVPGGTRGGLTPRLLRDRPMTGGSAWSKPPNAL